MQSPCLRHTYLFSHLFAIPPTCFPLIVVPSLPPPCPCRIHTLCRVGVVGLHQGVCPTPPPRGGCRHGVCPPSPPGDAASVFVPSYPPPPPEDAARVFVPSSPPPLCEKKQHIRAESGGPWPPWKIFSSVNIFGITYSCNRYTATITARLPVKQRHTAGQKVVQQVHSTLQSVAPAPPKEISAP